MRLSHFKNMSGEWDVVAMMNNWKRNRTVVTINRQRSHFLRCCTLRNKIHTFFKIHCQLCRLTPNFGQVNYFYYFLHYFLSSVMQGFKKKDVYCHKFSKNTLMWKNYPFVTEHIPRHIKWFPGWFPALELACHSDLIFTSKMSHIWHPPAMAIWLESAKMVPYYHPICLTSLWVQPMPKVSIIAVATAMWVTEKAQKEEKWP